MTDASSSIVEAAGGLLWRGGDGAVEVALVHRPKYDDWSLPKGKLHRGEVVLVGAMREVREETGHRAVLGRPLGELHYLKDGQPKRVRYWAMKACDGLFEPTDEIDQLQWATPDAALRRLAADHDRPILERFFNGPLETWPFVLVRHASAGDRAAWPGDDTLRPLDERGQEQTRLLTDILCYYGPAAIYSAPPLRCTETVRPLSDRAQLAVRPEPLLSEDAYDSDPEACVAWAVAVARQGVSVVACSQRRPVPGLAEGLIHSIGGPRADLPATRKGGFVVVHLADGSAPRVVDVEAIPPPA